MKHQKDNPYMAVAKNPRLPLGGEIFTNGAFCRPEIVIKDGRQMWQWVVSEFMDECCNGHGDSVSPNELVGSADELLKPDGD